MLAGDAEDAGDSSDEACETADGGDADAATVDEPLEETAGLEDVDGAAERANEAELEGGERVAVAAVLTDERIEGGVDELVAELADDRRHDQVVHLQLLVVVLFRLELLDDLVVHVVHRDAIFGHQLFDETGAGRLLRGLEGLTEVQTLHLHVDRLRKEEEGVEEPERFADNAEVNRVADAVDGDGSGD